MYKRSAGSLKLSLWFNKRSAGSRELSLWLCKRSAAHHLCRWASVQLIFLSCSVKLVEDVWCVGSRGVRSTLARSSVYSQ